MTKTRRNLLLVLTVLAACGTGPGAEKWGADNYPMSLNNSFVRTGQNRNGQATLNVKPHPNSVLNIAPASPGSQTLRTAGDSLVTQYRLEGASLNNPDSSWIPADTFTSPTRFYSFNTNNWTTMVFRVRGTTAADRANEAGTYSAQLVCTLSW